MNSIVNKLEGKLLVPFEALADRLTNEFQNVQARAYSVPEGSLTEYQGHGLYVDCLFTDAFDDETDNVALTVSLAYLTTTPRINAGVCWGHPKAYIEASFCPECLSSEDWPEVSDEVLDRLYADIPRLSAALIDAVKRRKSGD